ncbi:molybdenum cofactor guanylyltransferase [Cereibacter sphaeroides]|uniref:Molybdenum cofactor guanylyltransferase n=2 Tax=Cereibacter sphaeroides TaxID=1063 RepID=MOBA_CERS1|nr:molybdenum cofactor guanylyltransferase MobA [Cereibacter sphaeroides]A3PMC8.1 RecName: Full=Molybdenum cofactor guanylyltransferase; Short=MoCo guanylyltransferase; AltName: Full=GTP:molybdopterin guanylyltransferase; AltName: Full=Mo-MPT guanylyltransferase; AltName: Full=Molybdopterin guanylyltransferase; AltName: Full=Molybdopterin-guanine dinucleotide synthase; Short=MGD synthase [Cereibacter sphaeroides ATCC 17029]ABN77494.1 molybdenum cofactor guanylyltransferase [Cereibacter sphaeroide
MRLFGLILAGGEGRRMGGTDKASLTLGGRLLVTWVAERLGPQVEELAISANGDPARFAGLGLPVLRDEHPQGPLSGVLAGLRWAAAAGADALVTAPVDTPFVPGDLAPRLWLAGEGACAVAEAGGRVHPACGLWPVAVAEDLAAWLAAGEARVMGFAARHGAARAGFPDENAFLNLNAPEDLARAESLLRKDA